MDFQGFGLGTRSQIGLYDDNEPIQSLLCEIVFFPRYSSVKFHLYIDMPVNDDLHVNLTIPGLC